MGGHFLQLFRWTYSPNRRRKLFDNEQNDFNASLTNEWLSDD